MKNNKLLLNVGRVIFVLSIAMAISFYMLYLYSYIAVSDACIIQMENGVIVSNTASSLELMQHICIDAIILSAIALIIDLIIVIMIESKKENLKAIIWGYIKFLLKAIIISPLIFILSVGFSFLPINIKDYLQTSISAAIYVILISLLGIHHFKKDIFKNY